jgi:hypothetical protein
MEIIEYTEEHKEFREAVRNFLEKEVTLGFCVWICPMSMEGPMRIFSIPLF